MPPYHDCAALAAYHDCSGVHAGTGTLLFCVVLCVCVEKKKKKVSVKVVMALLRRERQTTRSGPKHQPVVVAVVENPNVAAAQLTIDEYPAD